MRLKIIILLFCLVIFSKLLPSTSFAEVNLLPSPEQASGSAQATKSAQKSETNIKQEDLTKPEEEQAKKEFIKLFSKRPIKDITFYNFTGFFVQYSVRSGVPANTIILVLLLPFLATLVVFFRQIIGLPTLEMLVPIALSITLIATGLTAGAILLVTILFASIVARYILKRIRIMQLPKMAISMLLVSIFVFLSLTASTSLGILTVKQLSFFPVLLLILLSDKIVALNLARGTKTAIIITLFTLMLGALGYVILSVDIIRTYVLLYPELLFILIPINILLGRYFGLRLTEYHRFAAFRKYVNQ